MLSDSTILAALPARDLERARRFYRDMLDLEPTAETRQGLIYQAGDGTRFLLFPSAGAPSGSHTQVTFLVNDLQTEVEDLKANGVVFEEYDLPDLKTVAGMVTTRSLDAAWFKDSEGNLLNLVQMDRAAEGR
jgi:catechol 2,3-dioxygenase-like lactoylglutathione lyase family enzyme